MIANAIMAKLALAPGLALIQVKRAARDSIPLIRSSKRAKLRSELSARETGSAGGERSAVLGAGAVPNQAARAALTSVTLTATAETSMAPDGSARTTSASRTTATTPMLPSSPMTS